MQSAPTRWERAYQQFETPEEELRKFSRRLKSIGAGKWNRGMRIVEVCSGRGTGLKAWTSLGFRHVFGVDFSPALVFAQRGPGTQIVGDARLLPLRSASVDVAIVQGGLHHLFTIEDLDSALAEMRRVVKADGRIVIIEPWMTPFLRFVHAITEQPLARKLSRKLDAFETMREEERETYERWLSAPQTYGSVIHKHVAPTLERRSWGKIVLVGSPRPL